MAEGDSKMINVLFFGPVVEHTGTASLQVTFRPGMTLQHLRDELAARYPRAFEIVCFSAVNEQHVRDLSMPLPDHSEVTFMANFSGA